jgi:hypothetical protein
MNCTRCGALIMQDSSYCEGCGSPVDPDWAAADEHGAPAGESVPPPRAGTFPAPPAPSIATAKPLDVLPGSPVRLANGERLRQTYEAVRLRRRRKGTGTLYVTDARVVFYAWAATRGVQQRSELVQEVSLQDIRGLSAYVTRQLSTLLVLLAFWFALATLATLFALALPLTLLFAILTSVCVALLFTPFGQHGYAGVVLHTRHVSQGAVTFGRIPAAMSGLAALLLSPLLLFMHVFFRAYTAFDVVVGEPGNDSSRVIAELGALIMDLQTRGEFAGENYGISAVGGSAPDRSIG